MKWFITAIAAGVFSLALSNPAQAQHGHGHGGHGHGGGHGHSGGHGGWGHGHGGWGHWAGHGLHWGAHALGWVGNRSFYGGYYYPNYYGGYSNYPYYSGVYYNYPSGYYSSWYSAPATTLYPAPATTTYAAANTNVTPASYTSTSASAPARTGVHVIVPHPEAKVTFNGHRTTSIGRMRVFEPSGIEPGHTYTYRVEAVWEENGETIGDVRQVPVVAGRLSLVDFTQPAPSEALPAPNKTVPKQ